MGPPSPLVCSAVMNTNPLFPGPVAVGCTHSCAPHSTMPPAHPSIMHPTTTHSLPCPHSQPRRACFCYTTHCCCCRTGCYSSANHLVPLPPCPNRPPNQRHPSHYENFLYCGKWCVATSSGAMMGIPPSHSLICDVMHIHLLLCMLSLFGCVIRWLPWRCLAEWAWTPWCHCPPSRPIVGGELAWRRAPPWACW